MREGMIRELSGELIDEGFACFYCASTRSCFDIAARRDVQTLLIKVLENIDGFTREQAEDLRKIASMLLGRDFLVGERAREQRLEEGVVYERFGVPTSNIATFKQIILGVLPHARKFKRMLFSIDGELLAKSRGKLKLSLEELARESGISKDTLYRYEHGLTGASAENLRKLEGKLKVNLRKPINPFEPETYPVRDRTVLSRIGFESIRTRVAPFDLLGKEREKILAGEEADRRTLKKMALIYSKISDIFKSYPCFILTRSPKDDIEGIPVVRKEEIRGIEKARELIKLIEERAG